MFQCQNEYSGTTFINNVAIKEKKKYEIKYLVIELVQQVPKRNNFSWCYIYSLDGYNVMKLQICKKAYFTFFNVAIITKKKKNPTLNLPKAIIHIKYKISSVTNVNKFCNRSIDPEK